MSCLVETTGAGVEHRLKQGDAARRIVEVAQEIVTGAEDA
jgi:hypothetical protein